jgi:5-methylcytosine-specific restriction endonuclease McrA
VKDWYQDNITERREKDNTRRRDNVETERIKDNERYERDREKRIALATEHSHRRKARKLNTVVEKGISVLSLKKQHGTKCHYCQKEMDFSKGVGRKFNSDMATIEHLIPLARGGEHTFANTVLACRFCNISRGAKSQEDFEEYRKEN